MELPDARPSAAAGSSAADGMMLDGERMDPAVMELKQRGFEEQYEAVVHEYSLLLTGQLEVQRAHYEERLDEIERRPTSGSRGSSSRTCASARRS